MAKADFMIDIDPTPQPDVHALAARVLERLVTTTTGVKARPQDVAFTAYEIAEAFVSERERRRHVAPEPRKP